MKNLLRLAIVAGATYVTCKLLKKKKIKESAEDFVQYGSKLANDVVEEIKVQFDNHFKDGKKEEPKEAEVTVEPVEPADVIETPTEEPKSSEEIEEKKEEIVTETEEK